MADKLVVVAGNIGVGKTSITERIGQKFGWNTSYEVVSTNPYLPNYYQDMKKWGFHLQIFFLGTRAEQYQQIVEKPGSSILDRSIYEDYYIFTQALRRDKKNKKRKFKI
jgi:deoxyadenosine/deoxycytidine kinase